MRVSITISNYTFPGGPDGVAAGLADVVRAADETGLHTVWVPDHLLQADPTVGAGQEDMLEACTALGYLAAVSTDVRLGTMVSAVTFRPPAVLIKAVTTLDVLSGGRAWLGVGAGYLAAEASAMGLPLPPTRERFEHLEDAVRLAKHVWAGAETPFHGSRHTLDSPRMHPQPLARPHPPILIGGAGERRTLRLVAQYADACNLFDIPDGNRTLRHKLDVLERHCRQVGRPVSEIERTLSTRRGAGQSVDEFVGRCREVAALGIDHIVMLSSAAWTPDAVRELRPIVEALAPVTAMVSTL